jgi:hypothetical protein
MWNCSIVVPLGTPLNENTGEPDPHQRKLIEKAEASAVLKAKNAAAQRANRMRMSHSLKMLSRSALHLANF